MGRLDGWPPAAFQLCCIGECLSSVGDKLGQYEIISLLGKGGIGEVWKAREAEVLASRDHRNIGTIYGLVDSALSSLLRVPTFCAILVTAAGVASRGSGPL